MLTVLEFRAFLHVADEDLLQDFDYPVYAEVLQEELIGKDFQGKSFDYKIYVTGTETGKVMLYVSGNPITFHATIGEIAFSDDNNSFTLTGSTSFFVFERV